MTATPWDLGRIRSYVAASLPLAALFGIDIIAAETTRARVRLTGNERISRPGGMVAGPVLFAMADIATYALSLMLRQQDAAATSNLLINFLRPAFELPLVSEAVALRAGRGLITYDVRIWPESAGPDRLVAQATATWAIARAPGAVSSSATKSSRTNDGRKARR
jgi:uncharacterized protein (TIGR00369 family)